MNYRDFILSRPHTESLTRQWIKDVVVDAWACPVHGSSPEGRIEHLNMVFGRAKRESGIGAAICAVLTGVFIALAINASSSAAMTLLSCLSMLGLFIGHGFLVTFWAAQEAEEIANLVINEQ